MKWQITFHILAALCIAVSASAKDATHAKPFGQTLEREVKQNPNLGRQVREAAGSRPKQDERSLALERFNRAVRKCWQIGPVTPGQNPDPGIVKKLPSDQIPNFDRGMARDLGTDNKPDVDRGMLVHTDLESCLVSAVKYALLDLGENRNCSCSEPKISSTGTKP
ncbi:MAG: hypothetical protein HY537_15515 [Deltaproteobacteria bacterium]|nr:hypothetical protein [Deltaproteobacteria bacterium]